MIAQPSKGVERRLHSPTGPRKAGGLGHPESPITTTTRAPAAHLLSPQRVDQLVREHLDPRVYPAYPAELITEHERLCQRRDEQIPSHTELLLAQGVDLLAHAPSPAAAAHHAWLNELDQAIAGLEQQIAARLQQRRQVLNDLYRQLPPVAAATTRTEQHRFLSTQQWLWHVHEAAAAIARSDKRANVLAVAEAL
ncbi:MAG: hypothetical protein ACK5MR_17605, partial [Cumulibacter sp.]